VRDTPGLAAFVRRAVILHTDAAIFATRFPPPPDDAPPSVPPGPGRGPLLPPPLLANDRFIMHSDGRILGEQRGDWNWPFARRLLDLLVPPRHSDLLRPDPHFAAEWYHAVASYLFALGDLADLRAHLQHSESLPDDPQVLFDRACFAETLGLSYNQALRDDADFVEAQRRSRLDLPGEERTDGEAEKLFRRALALDPSLAEARVRLARLLARRARYDEAAGHLAMAQASKPSPVVAFYADLVAGRVSQAQGRFKDSLDYYEAAAQRYPDAQSAIVGASQAAVMAGDLSRGLALVEKLGPRSRVQGSDPWRSYAIGAGRDVDALVQGLWMRGR
jgi:tetratricopeptide (TPR) repeat protein